MTIVELLNNRQDETVGYYAAGHHDRNKFAEECNCWFGLDESDYNTVAPHEVVVGWLSMEDKYSMDWLEPAEKDCEFAFAATYFFY